MRSRAGAQSRRRRDALRQACGLACCSTTAGGRISGSAAACVAGTFSRIFSSRAIVALQLEARHDHVDHAVLHQIFGALEAFRQLFADRLLDDARAGKADQRAGLGDVHVAQHGVGGGDAAGGRVGQHDDIGQAGFLQPVDRDRGARQLHQRQDALLHARAAGGGEQRPAARLLATARLERR